MQAISIEYDDKTYSVSKEPLSLPIPAPLPSSPLPLTLAFHGHYGEPPLKLLYPGALGSRMYNLQYHISQGAWQVTETN